MCTNVSCALAGAQQVVEAFERALGIDAGTTSDDGSFTLGTVECLGGCGWATVVAIEKGSQIWHPEALRGKEAPTDGAVAYVCEGSTCSLPLPDAAELGRALRERTPGAAV